MKNYVEKKGIKKEDILYTTPKGSVVRVLSTVLNGAVEVEIVKPIAGGSPAGAKGYIKVADMPGLAAQIEAARTSHDRAFEARYPGIDALLDLASRHEASRESFKRMMEDEGGVTYKSAPKTSMAEACAMYPIAAAYLDLLKLSNADPSSQFGYLRRKAGEAAFAAIEDGADVLEALDKANRSLEGQVECND